jgi:transcriptional regulator with XRE-family HTH domain
VRDQSEALAAFGERLRKLRSKTGLTQAQVGWRIDRKGPTIGSMERGMHGPIALPIVLKLAEAMGYTAEELLGDTGYVPPTVTRAGNGYGQRRDVPEVARMGNTAQIHPLVAELRRARQKSFSQQALAKLVGVSGPAVNDWEYGLTQPRLGPFVEWARVLGFEVKLVPIKEGE